MVKAIKAIWRQKPTSPLHTCYVQKTLLKFTSNFTTCGTVCLLPASHFEAFLMLIRSKSRYREYKHPTLPEVVLNHMWPTHLSALYQFENGKEMWNKLFVLNLVIYSTFQDNYPSISCQLFQSSYLQLWLSILSVYFRYFLQHMLLTSHLRNEGPFLKEPCSLLLHPACPFFISLSLGFLYFCSISEVQMTIQGCKAAGRKKKEVSGRLWKGSSAAETSRCIWESSFS